MPNHFFRFRQFTVHQEHCAMKVCTDACLFGAWMADWLKRTTYRDRMHRVLDIGTGTGLLSLMLAQQTTSVIDAIEIDKAAAAQAAENFAASPWKERLKVHHAPIQEFGLLPNQPPYDLILSNPPFFENHLESSDAKRNIALHCAGLSLDALWNEGVRLLSDNGYFAILLPFHRRDHCKELAAQKRFFIREEVLVHQTTRHLPFRIMLLFGKEDGLAEQSAITIKENNTYTDSFSALLKDYYLDLKSKI